MSQHSFGRTIVPRRVRVSTIPLAASARKPFAQRGPADAQLAAKIGFDRQEFARAELAFEDVTPDRIAHREPLRTAVAWRGPRGLRWRWCGVLFKTSHFLLSDKLIV